MINTTNIKNIIQKCIKYQTMKQTLMDYYHIFYQNTTQITIWNNGIYIKNANQCVKISKNKPTRHVVKCLIAQNVVLNVKQNIITLS